MKLLKIGEDIASAAISIILGGSGFAHKHADINQVLNALKTLEEIKENVDLDDINK